MALADVILKWAANAMLNYSANWSSSLPDSTYSIGSSTIACWSTTTRITTSIIGRQWNSQQESMRIRKDIYGDDALAWALYRDGQAAKGPARRIVAALRFRTADARLYFHAEMIYKAVGQTNKARSHLKQALAINSHFQPLLDEVAASEYAALNSAH